MPEMTDKKAAEKGARIKDYLAKTNNDASLDILAKTAEDYANGIRRPIWPTGFQTLDKMLDGGLHGSQLICIGAMSSLGKTSLILQIATQVAEQGQDVLIFSLEMSREELNAKTVSRYSYIIKNKETDPMDYAFLNVDGFTTNEILKGDVARENKFGRNLFKESLDRARKIAPHTFVYVGNNNISVDDVKEITERHIEATGRKPLVVLDYLQILSASKSAIEKHYDVRRSTNDDITSLKVLAREQEIPVIVISAFNRNSYAEQVSMSSFRESSGIEYSADVLFGLQYQGMDLETDGYMGEDGKYHPNGRESSDTHYTRVLKLLEEMQQLAAEGKSQPIELKILKNRNGSRGTVVFEFTPKFNYYTERDCQLASDATAKNTTSAGPQSSKKPPRKLK